MATLTPSNRHHPRTMLTTKENRSPHGSDTPSSTHSKNARIDDSKNKEHYFPPILPVTATPDLSLAPSKSILKLISAFDGLVSDPASLSPLDRQPREMTPEPEKALQHPTYLLSPVKALVGSVIASQKPEAFASSNFHDLIEAYCILNSRIRNKVLDPRSAATADTPVSQPTTTGSPSTPFYPAFEPIKDNIDAIVAALRHDISRALEDPLALAAQYPMSPPASDASPFSSEPSDPEPGKRKGMNEHQVKLARDLHTVSQSALKLLSTLFSLTSFVDCENSILSVSQCQVLLTAVLKITVAPTLPTPNARKTWSLTTSIISSNVLPEAVIKPASSRIAYTFQRAMEGELGKEGKKGAIGEALRGVQAYTFQRPHLFISDFLPLLPLILKLLMGNNVALRGPAGNALCAFAYGAMEYPEIAREQCAKVVESFMDAQAKKKKEKATFPPFLEALAAAFNKMNNIVYPKEAAEKGQAATTPEEQGKVQQTALWSLQVLSSLILLSGPALVLKQSLLFEPFMKALEIFVSNKRVYVRTAASYGWRAVAWVVVTSLGEKVSLTDEEQSIWMDVLSFVDKKIGVGIICGLLCNQDKAVNRKTRRELVIITLKEMARRRSTAVEVWEILGRLLADPEGAPSTENSWAINGLVPTVLLDGSLVEQDSKVIHGLIREEQQQEAGWIQCIPPWTREECEDVRDVLAEIWLNAVKSGGIENSSISPAAVDTWEKMVALGIDFDRLLVSILKQRAHEWTNIAEPNNNDRAEVATHDSLQLRCLRELWKPIAVHHMTIQELSFDTWSVLDPSFATPAIDLASDLLDLLLSADMDYDLKDDRVALRWVEVVCQIARISGDFVERILMKETRWVDYREQFWWSLCGPSRDDIYEALPRGAFHNICVAPFLETVEFTMGDEEWKAWEMALLRHVAIVSSEHRSVTSTLDMVAFDVCQAEHTAIVLGRISATLLGHASHYMRADDLTPESLWALLSTVLQVTYDEETDETTAYGLINVGHLKCVLDAAQSPAFVLSLLSNVGTSVVPWLSDDKRLLTDAEYNIAITPTYLAILSALERASDDKAEILENYGELLAGISTRITPGAPTFTAFVDFWQRVFGDHFDVEQAPSSLRVLLLISGCKLGSESPETQGEEQVPETPVGSTEEEEWQEVSNVLESISDSDDSACGIPSSPPLSVFEETRTTEASGSGSSSISSDEGEEEVPVELPEPALIQKLLRLRNSFSPSRMRRSQSQSPDITTPVPEDDSSRDVFSPATSDVIKLPAKGTQLEVSKDDQECKTPSPEDQVLAGLSTPTNSPFSLRVLSPVAMLDCGQSEMLPSECVSRPVRSSPTRTPVVARGDPLTIMLGKKRGREDEEETPSKRRKPIELLTRDNFPSSTDTEESGVEGSVEAKEAPADVESQSTSLKSVPKSVVSPTVSPKVVSKETLVDEEVPDLKCIERQVAPVSTAPLKRKREEGEVSKSASGKASSRPPGTRSPGYSYLALEQPSPSKRRRLETWSDSPVLRVLLPSSDELSSSDDIQPEDIPGSDDSTTTQGSFSPAAVYSPPVGSDEPGSDESPTKARLGRKQKRQQLGVRSQSVPVLSMALAVPVFNPRIDGPRPSVLRRAFTSYEEVQEALTSAFEFLKDNASSLGMSKLVTTGNLLAHTSTTVFGAMQKKFDEEN